MIRARVGDVLRLQITNPGGNANPHNVDLHAVTGQGGGAAATTVAPGETATIEARLLYPGFFLYHCAYGDVPAHIPHGMFGGVLVDPATPLPPVDHEWYIVQSEYYLADGRGVRDLDRAALRDEVPTHVVFNGAVGALTEDNALQMQVGERSRIYFVNTGLTMVSSFHPIGSHWDVVYPEAALLDPTPLRGSQTTLVPAGGGTVVEIVGLVPETAILVDHALSRAFDKGAIGQIVISGDEDTEIFERSHPAQPAGDQADADADGGVRGAADGETPEADETVVIAEGSSQFKEDGAPDEFAARKRPADDSVNVLEVSVGDTVAWTNDDATVHTVTAADGSFDSGPLAPGESWSHTFDEAGVFEYVCTPHPWMRARVVVSE